MSVYVSIGRNVGKVPMSDAHWEDFIARVFIAVTSFAGPVVSVTQGDGSYVGSKEATAIVVGEGTPSKYDTDCLKLVLKHLSREYLQDCIALTIANVEFIAP